MFFSKSSVLATVALTGVSLAAPSISRRDTMSCYCSDHGALVGIYAVYISAPFNGGVGCDSVYKALQGSGAVPTSWHCDAASDGNTRLHFVSFTGYGKNINEALDTMYPSVGGGFNCPDNQSGQCGGRPNSCLSRLGKQ